MPMGLHLQATEEAMALVGLSPSLPAMASLPIPARAHSLEGRVALVTGAGRGIGRGIAVALAAAGARVMAVSRTESDLASLQAAIGGEYCVASVADEAGCRRAVEETRGRLGPVEILVNNAGDADASDGPAWEVEPADWRLKLAVNLDAPFYLTRLVLPEMLAADTGRIVNVASTAGLVAGADMTAFVASKHGLVGLTRAVAIDAGTGGVTCNAVCPGWVRTGLTEDTDEVWAERAATYPAGRVVTIDEVASLVAYLASDAAAGISGEAIRVALGGTW
jgi:NAD(P)-dependent dehydrogenase (short-subunit alcohol dehydrogenase family)